MQAMSMTMEQTEDLVRRIVDTAHPIRIILFGSSARGEDGKYSDIDVLVVVPDGMHRRHTPQIIYRHLLGFGLPVDVVVATYEDMLRYSDSPGLIYKEALK